MKRDTVFRRQKSPRLPTPCPEPDSPRRISHPAATSSINPVERGNHDGQTRTRREVAKLTLATAYRRDTLQSEYGLRYPLPTSVNPPICRATSAMGETKGGAGGKARSNDLDLAAPSPSKRELVGSKRLRERHQPPPSALALSRRDRSTTSHTTGVGTVAVPLTNFNPDL